MDRGSPGRSNKPRMALGDLTNQLGKRGFSLISRGPASKTGVGNVKIVNKENDSHPAKRISLGGKDSTAEVSSGKGPKPANVVDKPLSMLKGGKTYRLHSLGNPDSASDSRLKSGSLLNFAEGKFGLFGSSSSNSAPNVVDRARVKETLVFPQSISEGLKFSVDIGEKVQDPEQKDESQATQTEPLLETLGSQTSSTDGKDSASSSIPATERPPFLGSGSGKLQVSKPFELESCMWLKGDPASASARNADSIKACSCSFCMKAAYIWSDLHYTDVKGRMSAIAKSKRETTNLVNMCSLEHAMGTSQGSSSNGPSELEADLMNQCKSLFVCMEDTFGKERTKLEAEMLAIKDMRDNFKTTLGAIDETPTDVQHSASDASDQNLA